MSTDEILTVTKVFQDWGDWSVNCPHCKVVTHLPSGPIRGEQFQHTNRAGCNGWFEVSSDAKVELP